MDLGKEVYQTAINGKQYTFNVEFISGRWIAWCIDGKIQYLSMGGDSSERASLSLVRFIEEPSKNKGVINYPFTYEIE